MRRQCSSSAQHSTAPPANSSGLGHRGVLQGYIPQIERVAGMKFERIGAPQPQDMAKIAASRTIEVIRAVDDTVVPYFEEAAKALLEGDEETGAAAIEPVTALAKALAKICGHTELKRRSLMNGSEDYVTMMIKMPGHVKVGAEQATHSPLLPQQQLCIHCPLT